MTELSGPVGIRNKFTHVANAPADQNQVIALLWAIDPAQGGRRGLSAAPTASLPRHCGGELAAAILAFQRFWVGRGELKSADGVVDPGGPTLRKLDFLAGGVAPAPPSPEAGFSSLRVLRFQQTLPVVSQDFACVSILPATVLPFLIQPVAKNAELSQGQAQAVVTELLIKIQKNGEIFWVGACVPAGTTDFSRAYVFFHPDTIAASDDISYPSFGGRWEQVQRYVLMLGTQLAAVKAMPFIVPFMTYKSRANSSQTNLFGDQGVETLNDILAAIQISLGRTGTSAPLRQIGVASFSSGVDHLYRFAEKAGSSGLIREQIDFDSAFMIASHKSAPTLPGVANWLVTQRAPPVGGRPGWLYLPARAFQKVHAYERNVHAQIGYMMFQAMMTMSIIL